LAAADAEELADRHSRLLSVIEQRLQDSDGRLRAADGNHPPERLRRHLRTQDVIELLLRVQDKLP
jgi:hypothetical protein